MIRLQPKALKKGDTVGIVSTARKISIEEIRLAIELLESWGLKAKVGKTIGLEHHQFAGTDEQRARDFQIMLDDDEIQAIWCARGGYGTVRIIDYLNFERFLISPKWIIGYSDVTVLHSHLHNLGIETLHAIMPIDLSYATEEAQTSLRKSLFGQVFSYKELGHDFNFEGIAKGLLVGGNLSMLYSLLGSKSAINTQGKILFLEDLDEYLYHVDRMYMNLKRNGYFDHLKGVIVGGMTKMNDNTIPFGKDALDIVCDIFSEFDGPICFNFPAGHLDNNKALILGREVNLEVNKEEVILRFNGRAQ